MANNDKNFKVKNGLDVKGSATVDNDLLVSGTLTAQTNTPSADSDVVNKAYVDTAVADTHDSAAVVGQINLEVDADFVEAIRPAETIFDLSSSSSPNYVFSGDGFPSNVNDPVLHLTRGKTYKFANISGSHPLEIRSSAGGSAYSNGVTNNGGSGSVIFTVPMDAPNKLYYQCTVHSSMLGTIYIDEIVSFDSDISMTGDLSVTGNITVNGNDVLTTASDTHDSAAVLGQINATVNQAYIDALDTHDSAAIQAMIDATDTHDSAAVQGQIDSAVTLAFINGLDASATNWDSDLIPGLVLGTDVNGNYVVDVTGTANQIEVTHTQGEGSTAVIGLPNNVTIDSDLTVNGVIKGPSTFIIDPALHGDSSGTLVILGNLQVDGTTTTIQSSTVSISDQNIVLADSATNNTQANGAGITVNGSNAKITYVAAGDQWEFNKAPYYLTNRLLTTADDLHDSAAVQGQIDSAVTLAFINSLDASATDWDSDLIPALRTDDVNEGTNLYYTNTRARASVSGNKGLTYNSSTGVFDIDSANIYSFTIDSARTIGLIDSAYVEARIKQSFIDTFDTHDSAAVVGQIGLEVTKTFVDNLDVDAITLGGNDSSYYLNYNNFTNTPTLPAQVISYDSASELADSAVNARTDQDLFTTSDVEFNKVTSNLVGSVHFTAQNDEGTALVKGDVVYIKGISGNTPTVAKADADDATKMPAFGVVYAGANNGANVTITTLSVLEGLDTQTPGWSEGDTLYVSTVAGQLTNTKPTGESSLIQNIGQVTRVDNSAGSIKILGAGRTAATPNLNQNNIFIGNASNQSITMSLDSAVDSDHVQSKIKQSFIDTFDTHDSAAVAGQIADTLNDTVTITKHSTTDPVLKLQTTNSTSDAAPIMEFVRNTDQANNGDYLGQIKFLGEDSSGTANGEGVVYAKMTGKISDPTDGTEDGLIEYMVKSNGSNLIMARMTGNNGGKLIMENGAGIELDSGGITVGANGNITIAGNSVLTTASDTHDSAAVVGQIDSAYIQPLARAAIVAGDNITYDSDTGVISSSGGGTSSSYTLDISLLDTSLPQALDVGDPVYYDSDAVKWTGAKATTADVASHIIVEKDVSTFKIAQTGVFTLSPHQGLDINSYYYLLDSAGFYTNNQPTVGISQTLFYALDSSTIDVNIAEAIDLSAVDIQVVKEEILADAIGAATAMAIVF